MYRFKSSQGVEMSRILKINDLSDPELLPYSCTNEIQLKRIYEPDPGLFIAESPKVIRRALADGYEPVSLLCEQKYIDNQASDIISACSQVPVYTADSEVLTQLTGFRLTQGVLCAMRRRALPKQEGLLANAERIVVLEELGADAVFLTPASSDPLYRRSIRVSMGTVFQLPWTYLEQTPPHYIETLKQRGFFTIAMALRDDTLPVSDPGLARHKKLAVILGTEGEGLKSETISCCDCTVKIPMYHGVDSLNVASASGIVLWELMKK